MTNERIYEAATDLENAILSLHKEVLTLSKEYALLKEAALKATASSGRGLDCLPEGWVAVQQGPFDHLRRVLASLTW